MSVAVVEEGPFGGTCLNRGCIPSKILIHCADVMETIQRSELFGIKARVESIDWQRIIRRASEEIDEDAKGIEEGNRQSPNIVVFKGTGRFVQNKTLEVNGEQINAESIVIAAGSRPSVPNIPGLQMSRISPQTRPCACRSNPAAWPSWAAGISQPKWPTSLAPWERRSP